ncbi:hypothetical protein Golob_018003, partial [Gossypium lobatum]|nr:hypothetical protein [Gossypium lobatum]
KSNVGIEEAAREEGKVALSKKSENIKKGFGKIRGKGVIVANGPNPNNNVLKPSNNLGASSSRPFANPFEDGSRMRPIIVDKDLDPIHFQVVVLVTLSDDVSLTIPIALAFDIIIQGLSQEIKNVMSMSEVKVGVHEVEDVSLNQWGNADSVIVKLGFDNSFKVEAFGFAGGFWLLWNDDVDVEVLKAHPEFIHLRIFYILNHFRFLCTIIYASPQKGKLAQLWEKLGWIVANIVDPWLIV